MQYHGRNYPSALNVPPSRVLPNVIGVWRSGQYADRTGLSAAPAARSMTPSSRCFALGTRQSRLRSLAKISEPVPEKRRGRRAGREVLAKRAFRQVGAQGRPARGARALFEACQSGFGLGVEIARRDGWIGIACAGEKPRNVAQIFPLQRQRVIFGVTLEEHELAARLFGKDIDAGLPRLRQ